MRLLVLASIVALSAAGPAAAGAPPAQPQAIPNPSDRTWTYATALAAAESGDPEAQWNLGMILLNGQGVAADEREAYRWVRASGEAGYKDGMISTAVMLAMGQGVARDPAAARDWYVRAARQHRSAHALRGLAGMLIMGDGGPADLNRGLAYLELAQEAGDANAAYLIGQVGPAIAPQIDRSRVDALKAEWIAEHGRPQ